VEAPEPPSSGSHFRLGRALLENQPQSGGTPLLQEAARLAPQEAKPFYLLGSAFNRLGRYTEAAAALEQAASRSPEDADVYYQLAHAYGHLHRPAEREKALERFTQIRASGEKLSESQREAARLAKGIRPIVAQTR
jgi:tetratricopeptide (TPR) repeat protein